MEEKYKIKIYFAVWGLWMAINFLIAPLPIIILKFFPSSNTKILFSSYLSYIFSFLVTGGGVLYFYFKKEKIIGTKDFLFWMNLFVLFIIGFVYVFYNLPNNFLAIL